MKPALFTEIKNQVLVILNQIWGNTDNFTFCVNPFNGCNVNVVRLNVLQFIVSTYGFTDCDIFNKTEAWTTYLNNLLNTYATGRFNICSCVDSGDTSVYEGKTVEEVFFYDFTKKYDVDDFQFQVNTDGVTTRTNDYLQVDSSVFTYTTVTGDDHEKWLRYNNYVAPIPTCGEIIYESTIAVKQNIPTDEVPPLMISRIRDVSEDIRLATAGISIFDPSTWLMCDILFSDEIIYGVYGRLPFGKPLWTEGGVDYAAFYHCMPIGKRTDDPANDFVRVAIGVTSTGHIKWYVDGVEKFSIERIGVRLLDQYRMIEYGGPAQIVKPTSFYFGFGTMSYMDGALPNNYSRELVVGDQEAASQLIELEVDGSYMELNRGFVGGDRPLIDKSITFAYQIGDQPNDNHDIKLFGQGATLKIKYQKLLVSCDTPDSKQTCVPTCKPDTKPCAPCETPCNNPVNCPNNAGQRIII
jgi:hypothetical protein